MSNGDDLKEYFKEVSKFPLLAREEEIKLAQKIENGEPGARTKLVNSNLRLVISIAKRYRNSDVSFADLIQAGNVGLLKAVDRYDWRKGNKFSTYAYWWIRQTVLKTLHREQRTVRVPEQLTRLRRKIKEEERAGKIPNDELAGRLNVPQVRIERAKKAINSEVSLDKPISEDNGDTLADVIADEGVINPEVETMKDLRRAELNKVMAEELTDREMQIVKLRHGFEGNPKTLAQVGEILELSKERIRQLEKRAIEKLRHQESRLRLSFALRGRGK